MNAQKTQGLKMFKLHVTILPQNVNYLSKYWVLINRHHFDITTSTYKLKRIFPLISLNYALYSTVCNLFSIHC